MQLIDNWKDAPRMFSVIAAILLAFFDTAYAAEWWGLGEHITPNAFAAINAVVAGLVIPILRVVKQFYNQPDVPAQPAEIRQ